MKIDIVRTTIERDLGAPLAVSFASFDETAGAPSYLA